MTDAEALLRDLTDPEPEIRLQAVLAAAGASDAPAPPALVTALVRRLDDEHPGVQQAALESLSRMIDSERAWVDEAALGRALALAEHESPRVRAEATRALGAFCDDVESPARVETLLRRLDDEDGTVRAAAAAACGDLRIAAAAPRLADQLADDPVGFEAAFALANLGDARARPVLERALRAQRTRLDAMEGLRRLGDAAAAPALRPYARGRLTPWVDRLSAWATLFVLGDADAGARLVARTTSRRMEERVYALFLVGRYRVPAGRAPVERVARDVHHPERETGLDALGWYGDDAATAYLIEVAEAVEEALDARLAAIRALSRVRSGAAAAARARLRRDLHPAVRAAAADPPGRRSPGPR